MFLVNKPRSDPAIRCWEVLFRLESWLRVMLTVQWVLGGGGAWVIRRVPRQSGKKCSWLC